MGRPVSDKSRISWIDNVRFFAIVAVVIGHCLGMLTTNELPGTQFISSFIVAFNMPLFFFISGYVGGKKLLSVHSVGDWARTIKNSFLRMMVPVVTFTLMLVPFHNIGNPLIFYWFLHSLFRIYIIIATASLIAQAICKNDIIKYVIIIAISIIGSWMAGNFTMEFILYFLLGVFLSKTKVTSKITISVSLLLIGFILFPFISNHSFYSEKAQWAILNIPYQWFMRQVCGICLSLGICGLFAKYVNAKTCLTQLGTMTLGIYLIHDFFVEMILRDKFNWKMNLTNIWGWFILIALVVVIITFCYICISILRKNKYSKAIFLGEK